MQKKENERKSYAFGVIMGTSTTMKLAGASCAEILCTALSTAYAGYIINSMIKMLSYLHE